MLNTTEILKQVLDIIEKITPEVDGSTIDSSGDICFEFGFESMDFLHMVVEINEILGIEIPLSDYGAIRSLDDLVEYLEAASV